MASFEGLNRAARQHGVARHVDGDPAALVVETQRLILALDGEGDVPPPEVVGQISLLLQAVAEKHGIDLYTEEICAWHRVQAKVVTK